MIEITPAEESQILAQREAHKIRQSGGYGPAAKLTTQETDLLEQLADLNEARLAMGYSVIGPSPPRSAASYWSAYSDVLCQAPRARLERSPRSPAWS